jgi:hypothetical protein
MKDCGLGCAGGGGVARIGNPWSAEATAIRGEMTAAANRVLTGRVQTLMRSSVPGRSKNVFLRSSKELSGDRHYLTELGFDSSRTFLNKGGAKTTIFEMFNGQRLILRERIPGKGAVLELRSKAGNLIAKFHYDL